MPGPVPTPNDIITIMILGLIIVGVGLVLWKSGILDNTPIGNYFKLLNSATGEVVKLTQSYSRGAGDPAKCEDGQDNQAGLCYPKAKDGYNCALTTCAKNCPDNTTDAGLFCTKNTTNRGVGTIPDQCSPDQEKQGLLCYPKAKDGYNCTLSTCFKQCPDGMAEAGISCTKKSYGRGAGTTPNQCPSGQEKNGALCYDTCKADYTGVANLCWSNCPTGYTDAGATCFRPADTITKDRYKRTDVGRIPNYSSCPSGYTTYPLTCTTTPSCSTQWDNCSWKTLWGSCVGGLSTVCVPINTINRTPSCNSNEEMIGGLCYPKCQPGYTSSAGDILYCTKQGCPTGYSDTGLTCYRAPDSKSKSSYSRGAGSPLQCSQDQDSDNGLCYKKCDAGFIGVGPVCWSSCPSDFKDTGTSCLKPTYDRGAGSPMQCSQDQDNDAGLCYPKCPQGYAGKGPICWPSCPSDFKDIGVSCQKPTYDRGVGKIPTICPPNTDTQIGTCFPPCKSGYSGQGPLCVPDKIQ
jgi:hypothetical protein